MKRSPITRVNAVRARAKFRRNFHSPQFVEFTRERPCKTCGQRPSQCSHAVARGMGGCGGDWTTIFPQCGPCHTAYAERRAVFFAALGLTQDDITRFTIEHRQAFERHVEASL